MNRKLAYLWIFLILIGFITTDFIYNSPFIYINWICIEYIGFYYTYKVGWKQNALLTLYWITSIILGTILSAYDLYAITNSYPQFPINHISTIWMIIIGLGFIVTAVSARIIYFGIFGIFLIVFSVPLDSFSLSFPATTYGIILSLGLIGYVIMTYLTPYEKANVGTYYEKANGFEDKEHYIMHKFRCMNCNFIYEGYSKLDYCPRCMAGSDLLADID